jgi:hypothetical protein
MACGQKKFSKAVTVLNHCQVFIIPRSGRLVFGLQSLQSKETYPSLSLSVLVERSGRLIALIFQLSALSFEPLSSDPDRLSRAPRD